MTSGRFRIALLNEALLKFGKPQATAKILNRQLFTGKQLFCSTHKVTLLRRIFIHATGPCPVYICPNWPACAYMRADKRGFK